MKFGRQRFRVRLREPLVLDRRFDLGYALLWFTVSAWALCQSISSETTVARASTFNYTLLWGTGICISALIAGLACLSTLFISPLRVRITKKAVELGALTPMFALIAVFPALSLVGFIFSPTPDEAASFFLGLFVCMVIFWRFISLSIRIKALRKLLASEN